MKSILKPRLKYSLLLFVIILFLSSLSIYKNRQLGLANGAAEEYFGLGWNLYTTGSFFPDENIPFVFRPPGYLFFIASALKIWDTVPILNFEFDNEKEVNHNKFAKAFKKVYLSQCFLLSLSAVFLFLLMSKAVNIRYAFILCLLFGCNPHLLILNGFLRYDILHVFLIILSCFLLYNAVQYDNRAYKMLLAGIAWGLTTLVRPMTLILPPIIFVMIVIKNRWLLSLKASLLFMVGMVCVIAPYTMRNYYLTNKLIIVNAQGSIALWASTATKLKPISSNGRWADVHNNYGMPIFKEVTKSPKYNYYLFVKHNLELCDRYRSLLIENFIKRPWVYFSNAVQNFIDFNIGYSSAYIDMFFSITKHPVNKNEMMIRRSENISIAFKLYMHMLTIAGFLGVGLVITKTILNRKIGGHQRYEIESGKSRGVKDPYFLVPIFGYLCFCIAHTITYMDYMYYYSKIPFMFLFISFLINEMDGYAISVFPLKGRISAVFLLNSFLVLSTFGIMISIIFR